MDRRIFLRQSINTLASSAIPFTLGVPFNVKAEPNPLISSTPKLGLSTLHWQSLDSALKHLLPSGKNSPGAKEIYALQYFHFILGRPDLDPAEYQFLINGIKQLTELSTTEHKRDFATLSHTEKEATLRKLESTHEGYYWLRSVLQYLMEALLGDPAYGANPGGVGWQWLEIKPGFPRPTPSQARQASEVRLHDV